MLQTLSINNKISFWKKILNIEHYVINVEKISIYQVSDDFCFVGNSFVGISTDHTHKIATIFHTRQLQDDDIIHELLHVKYPDWTEAQVNKRMDELLKESKMWNILNFQKEVKIHGHSIL
jgi:hypothetical protein